MRQFIHQVFELVAEIVLMPNIVKTDAFRHDVRIGADERRVARRQLIQDNAESPPVRLHVVALLRNYLWRHVLRRPTY